ARRSTWCGCAPARTYCSSSVHLPNLSDEGRRVAVADTKEVSRRGLSRREWVSIGGMAGFVLLLNVVGWVVLAAFVAPHHYALGTSGVFGIGLGVTAFTLGMRHAFDADHIAAI